MTLGRIGFVDGRRRWPVLPCAGDPGVCRAMQALMLVTAVCQLVYWSFPGTGRSVAFCISIVWSVAMLARYIHRMRPWQRRPWRLILAGLYVWVGASIPVALLSSSTEVGTWVVPGIVSLGGVGLVGAGVIDLALREGLQRDTAVWLESLVCSIAYLLLWWVVAGDSVLAQPLTVATAVANIYPLGDALLLSAAIVLLGARSGRDTSSRALVGAILVAIGADLLFGCWAAGLAGETSVFVTSALWMVEFALMAAAAAAASVDDSARSSAVSSGGVLALTTAVVIPAMACLLGERLTRREPTDAVVGVVVVGTVLMVAALTGRMLLLVREIEAQNAQLDRTARTDELTGLPNRRAGMRILHDAVRTSRSRAQPLCVAMVDLDHFKDYNDQHGHQQGDRLLRRAGLAWRTALGSRGLLYRYGGEEFVVVFPATGLPEAQAALDEMRLATPRRQTFSAGVALLGDGEDADALLARADLALYAAKAAGRSRTCA